MRRRLNSAKLDSMSGRFVVHHDLDGTWSVRDKETGRHALFRGSPVAGLSEKSAASKAKWLDEASDLLTEKSEKRKRREETFEELIGALYEHAHWLDIMKNIRVFGREDTPPPSPLPKARAIVAIYFPGFVDQIHELEDAARVYELWMIEGSRKRLAGETARLNEGFNAAYKSYHERFSKVIASLQLLADTEFGH